jgi:hypothetical protein
LETQRTNNQIPVCVFWFQKYDAVIEEPDTFIDFRVLSQKIYLYHSENDSIPYLKSTQSISNRLSSYFGSYLYKDDCKKFCFKDVYIQDINGNVLKLEGIRECYNINPTKD